LDFALTGRFDSKRKFFTARKAVFYFMPKSRKEKQKMIAEFRQLLQTSKAVIFSRFSGLSVAQVNALRRLCKEKNVSYTVLKKTLMRIAFVEEKTDFDIDTLDGEIATVFSRDDEVSAAKVVSEFAKTNEALKCCGGLLHKQFLNADEVRILAKILSKQELFGRLVCVLQSPIREFMNILQGNLSGFMTILRRVQEKKTG
jgi:large subunit ribosomal protein L10